jgi:hypothetical protein
VTYAFGFIGVREKPVAADMDMDGYDDIGLWVPDRAGVNPKEQGEFYFLVSGGTDLPTRIAAESGTADFKPVPFGNDLFATYGDEFAAPLVGNFDPPATPTASQFIPIDYTNWDDADDIDGDGDVTPSDVLMLINDINSEGVRQLGMPSLEAPFLDCNGDGLVSAADVIQVINRINSDIAAESSLGGEGEWAPETPSSPAVSDAPVVEVAAVETVQPELATVELAMLTLDVPAGPAESSPSSNTEAVDRIFAETEDDQVLDGRYAVVLDELGDFAAETDEEVIDLEDAADDLDAIADDLAVAIDGSVNGTPHRRLA